MPNPIHRAARHALADDPWRAEKEAKAVEVLARLRDASWHGRRANREPTQDRFADVPGFERVRIHQGNV